MSYESELLDINTEKLLADILYFIRNYIIGLKKEGVLVGLSGGIDSCVVLKLCVEAVGKDNVLAVILPEKDSDSKNIKDALKFADSLDVRIIYKKITPFLWLLGVYNLYPPSFIIKKSLQEKFVKKERDKISKRIKEDIFIANLEGHSDKDLNKGIAYYRIKHRIRSSILFYYSELNNYLFVGTVNKTERITGFFVKYGDSIADIMPLNSLYKTQVIKLAKFLKIDESIIKKQPSPDLIPGIKDEDMIGLPYIKLDLILFGIENNYIDNDIIKISKASQTEINRVKKIIEKSEYLRAWPIGL